MKTDMTYSEEDLLEAIEDYALYTCDEETWHSIEHNGIIEQKYYPILRDNDVLCDPFSEEAKVGEFLGKWIRTYYQRFGKIPDRALLRTFLDKAQEEVGKHD